MKTYFKQYEALEDDAEKQALADKICLALTVHTQIEEEIYYPATREAIDDDDLLDEAEVEHASAKQLIAEMAVVDPTAGGNPVTLTEEGALTILEEALAEGS